MFYRWTVFAAAILTAACSKTQKEPPPRYAVLRFENLTSDPGLDWVGRAASEVLAKEISAIPARTIHRADDSFGRRPVSAPGVSTEFTEAVMAGGNRILTGYFEKVNGKLRFTAVEENSRTGRIARSATAEGPAIEAISAIGKQFSLHPVAYATQNESALRAFIQATETQTSDYAAYGEAIAADPKFSDAYLGWSDAAVRQGDTETVERVLAEARANGLGETTLAKLEFSRATAKNDQPARMDALRRIVAAEPADTAAVETLGESQLLAHKYAEAAATYGKGSDSQGELLNLKSYALMWGGLEKEAYAAIREYQAARPDDANTLDSEGDAQLYFGHFADAERTYLRAAAMDPQFNQGAELLKAAHARLLAGDVMGANHLFESYKAAREKAKDATMPYREAQWRFATGDRAGGLDGMRAIVMSAANSQIKLLALAQSAVWELRLGRREEALRDATIVLRVGQNAATVAALLVRFAAEGDAPLPELEARAGRMFNGAGGARLVPVAIGYTLAFFGRYREAVPYLKQIYNQVPPSDQEAAFLYGRALQASGQAAEAARLLKANPIPLTNPAVHLDCLYFPDLFQWRGDQTTYSKLAGGTGAPIK